MSDVEKIVKNLKNNQTRDPIGMINELFKPGVMGQDMKKSVLLLVNGVKVYFSFPEFMQLANISSLYKDLALSRIVEFLSLLYFGKF